MQIQGQGGDDQKMFSTREQQLFLVFNFAQLFNFFQDVRNNKDLFISLSLSHTSSLSKCSILLSFALSHYQGTLALITSLSLSHTHKHRLSIMTPLSLSLSLSLSLTHTHTHTHTHAHTLLLRLVTKSSLGNSSAGES